VSGADRALAWVVTGPVGRVAAFIGDLIAYGWGRLRERARERRGG
jgi:hypothetical protein